MLSTRRRGLAPLAFAAAFSLCLVYFYLRHSEHHAGILTPTRPVDGWQPQGRMGTFWSKVPVHYPPSSIRPLPSGKIVQYPCVQTTTFPAEQPKDARAKLRKRQQAVKAVFAKCWKSYKEHAWGADELAPVSGGRKNHFGGWGATLVDSLDTLWIMDMKADFDEAVAAAEDIDFTHTDLGEVNVFETTIRYLGGFLSAYDLSGDVRLLRKAVEVGEMLYKAFDTPTRMPITRWDLRAAARGERQSAPDNQLVAEIGTLSMEFTRLSMLTGEPKWFDAVQRITDEMAAQQDTTRLPGLWPLGVNGKDKVFNSGDFFTLGAMTDSVYEYLPKMAALLGGQLPEYQAMYEKAMDTATKHLLFRPLTPTDEDILIAGSIHVRQNSGLELEPQGQHLVCFLGGLMALGGQMFKREGDVDLARKLVEGCVYTYKVFPQGVMPEVFAMVPCNTREGCKWDEKTWKDTVVRSAGRDLDGEDSDAEADAIIERDRLPKGFTAVSDRRYILRPEAIESLFVLYRVTGREDLLESAWDMFTSIDKMTSTELANSAVGDVTGSRKPEPNDSMESFWLGETLKYFYLIFSDPGLVSLDEFVFNTEAHPFRRLVR